MLPPSSSLTHTISTAKVEHEMSLDSHQHQHQHQQHVVVEAGHPDAGLRQTAIAHVDQAIVLLQRVIVSDETLQWQSTMVPGSSVGKHLRHVHDHFRILLDAAKNPEGVLNYDARQRNIPMETSREEAIRQLIKLRKKLLVDASKHRRQQSLTLHATTPQPQEFETNFGRELWFASLHATHHFALVRVIVTELQLDAGLPKDFGVAPSTIKARL